MCGGEAIERSAEQAGERVGERGPGLVATVRESANPLVRGSERGQDDITLAHVEAELADLRVGSWSSHAHASAPYAAPSPSSG